MKRKEIQLTKMLELVKEGCLEKGYTFKQEQGKLRYFVTIPYKSELYNFVTYDPLDYFNLMFTSEGSSEGADSQVAIKELYPVLKAWLNQYKIIEDVVEDVIEEAPVLTVSLTATDIAMLQELYYEANLCDYIEDAREVSLWSRLGVDV